ncbi:polysaccharide deacetylase family protein [Cohnella xylanilytica]|uniref:polysaccharide deacetylase family protein n=1 Tax=Cohnella xylanilytica TaxID=557555 RepID=UPI001FEAA33F|nr:polysaccharide deacetylase family protein [Cohnella xylanilytica]
MYHYVTNSDWRGIVPFRPEEFEKQLDWITENYEVVAPDGLQRPTAAKPRCVLTFDDGTKDQYEVAFQILKRRGLPAYFTVMSGPLLERIVPIFHLVHTVLSYFDDEKVWNEIRDIYDVGDIAEQADRTYHYEKDIHRRFNKYALNFVLSEDQSRSYLEGKVLSRFRTFEQFVDSFYINEQEFIEMRQAGMTLGVHATHHRPYDGEVLQFIETEILPCRRYMRERLAVNPEWYTPAFGGGLHAERMMRELEEVLPDYGFKGAFSTNHGFNDGLNSFWLKRYDCIHLPPRKGV